MKYEKRKGEREFLVKWGCSWTGGELVIGAYDEKELRKKFKKIVRRKTIKNHDKNVFGLRLAKIYRFEEIYYRDSDSIFTKAKI